MTDILKTKLANLDRADTALQDKLNHLSGGSKDIDDAPEKWARAISTLMKAMDDIAARREKINAKIAAQTHTRYEDMPPPTPEDEARFNDRFRKLIRSLEN